jgi:perosamine synthetase
MITLPIFNTFIHPDSAQTVASVLNSTFVSEGQIVKDFELGLEKELGLEHCVTVNSGTAALHLALVLAGVGAGDEVIIPAQTFVATGLVVLQQQAKVVFADIDYETGNISIESFKSKITSKTKAVIPVHWGGYPCNMDELNDLAKQHNIVVIEDAAHALGAIYKNKFIGQLSHYTCFSFQAIKHLTTGDGGAITIPDSEKFAQANNLKWFGIDRKNAAQSELGERQYNIEQQGFKYHLNNYAAALGLANLNGFGERMTNRRLVAELYEQHLKKVAGVNLLEYKADRQSAYWLFPFHVEKRLDFIRRLKEKGITASVVHQRIDRNEVFGGIDHTLLNQKKFDSTQIHIPIHDGITMEHANFIVQTIKEGW